MTDLSADALKPDGAADIRGVSRVGDWIALLKPRVMSLVVFTGFVGLWLAPGHIHPVLATVAVAAIAIGAGASGAINMWFDRDIDAVMTRTRRRPIPAGKIAPDDALGFGVLLAIFSVVLMTVATNVVAGGLLALTIAFYVFVYTIWLKRRTPQNIVIGGAAGAFPPMIGWAAVTGSIDWASLSLFLLIFMWTPPHFWALSLFHNDDYRRAGVPMLPVVAGERATKIQMLAYCLLLLPTGILPTVTGVAGWGYGAFSLAMGVAFLAFCLRVWRAAEGEAGPARAMFKFSLAYLFLLFAALVADRLAFA
ncbi:MAG: protoheme IX farnesyltransferase [Rhodospirillales bacterium]|nr:MAG: protoheme IX farnesyltransferase [Rhodospirillales bacterium]